MAHILVIDDELMIRELLRDILEPAGYEVEEAATSEEGMACFRRNPADLVIIDLFVPARGGLEIIHRLRTGYPQAKIIAISGVGTASTGSRFELSPVEMARRAGAMRTFKKPFAQEAILEAVEELVRG